MASPQILQGTKLCSVVAPAGCGKTHLIASTIARAAEGRVLVLTHTHAGVDVLRRRLFAFGVPPARVVVDTIAGWCLRLAASFPTTSGVTTNAPMRSQWNTVYAEAGSLLRIRPIQAVVRASYSDVYVDEYQDCTLEQHAAIRCLAGILPCRVLGDPLQGIFGFRDQPSVDWAEDVEPHFPPINGPTKPWRWEAHNPALGTWLGHVRSRLDAGLSIDLGAAPGGVAWKPLGDGTRQRMNQRDACLSVARRTDQSVVAIPGVSQQGHKLARSLKGSFSCVEPIDSEPLDEFARRMDEEDDAGRAVAVLDLAAKCMTQVKGEMKTLHGSLASGRAYRGKKHPDQAAAVQRVARPDGLNHVAAALVALRSLRNVVVTRRELLRECDRAVREVTCGEESSVQEAARKVRARSSRVGRLLPRRALGTTLLVKGLEFDHAVILNADGLDARNLYVAMTRASRTLTVLSNSRVISPKALKR